MGKGMKIGLDTVVTPSEELVSSDLDGETVMMSIENGQYYGLDEIGSRVWALIEEPRSVSELCDVLVEEYEVAREQCEQDVLAFLNELAEDNLVKVADTSVA